MLILLTDVIFSIGLTLGVGASTFALVFYISALEDGTIDDSEKRFMHIVYTVLRIGMVLIFLGIVGGALLAASLTKLHILQLILLVVITLNAVLMTYRLMPMKYGPILAGGSWYSLFFITTLPMTQLSYGAVALAYLLFLLVFYVVFHYCKRTFAPSAR